LPILWDDNYFSLLPGESREIDGVFAAEDLAGAAPVVEVGGWNIQSPFDCTDLKVSAAEVKPGQLLHVTASIRNTFLDAGRIDLWVDNRPADWRMLWARAGKTRELAFDLRLSEPGRHEIRVGARTAWVVVK
jgi:hypothetical protein